MCLLYASFIEHGGWHKTKPTGTNLHQGYIYNVTAHPFEVD